MSVKTMQQLLNEIDQVKIDVEESTRTLRKIDTRQIKAAANRDRSIEGRKQIKRLCHHIIELEKQMDIMTKKSDPNWPIKTFDKTKQNALKTLSNLSKQLSEVDKHLEKATGLISPAIYTNDQPVTTSTESENRKGVGALTKKTTTQQRTSSSSSEEEDTDEDIVRNQTQKPQSSSQLIKKQSETSTNESEDDTNDNQHLLNEPQRTKVADNRTKDSDSSDSESQTSSSSSLTPISNKPPVVSTSTPLHHQRTSNPQESAVNSTTDQDDQSYSDEEDDELKGLHESSDQEETKSDHSNTRIEKDRQEVLLGKHLPGTKFRVTHNFPGDGPEDLPIQKDELLILVDQPHDDDGWWLFDNPKTQQRGLVPINHIQPLSKTNDQRSRHRIKPISSASALINVFKANKSIPSGCTASNLAPLTEHNQYKLFHTLIPQRTESNFEFTDLHWQYDTDQIYPQQVEYQKILTIKKCSKIPKIKGEQIRVLNRCVRVCVYDGTRIISNIHSIRISRDTLKRADSTEDWYFVPNNHDTYIDAQSELLLRSNEHHSSILIELSQLCQSKINEEKCEINCGWVIIPFNDILSSGIGNTKNFNVLLKGGDFQEDDRLLDSDYKTLHSQGLSGKIDRYKQARIRFSLESREKQTDLLYDNLPKTSMIVPKNLIRILVFYRNELAYQLRKRYRSDGVSTKSIDSMFLSTFSRTLEQPDLIFTVRKLYHRDKDLTTREQTEDFLEIYQSYIYPLLSCRQLPPYNFHDITTIKQRSESIVKMVNDLLPSNIDDEPDILKILLDPGSTNKWRPFTTDEVCFSLQNYARNYTSKTIIS